MHSVFKKFANYFKKDPNFKMTEDKLNKILPSGQRTVFENRVGGTKTYLKKALFIKFKREKQKLIEESQEIERNLSADKKLQFPYEQIKNKLKEEILEKLKNIPPRAFEMLILDLLLKIKMGYGANIEKTDKILGQSGKEGMDGIIKQDPLGLDTIFKQKEGMLGLLVGQKFKNSND